MTIVNNSTFLSELERLNKVVNVYSCNKTVVIDVETNGLDPYGNNQICGIGVGEDYYSGLTQYYPFRHHQGENLSFEYLEKLIDFFNTSIETFIGYNIKFDLHFLEKEGLNVSNKELLDVIVMTRLAEPSEIKDLGLTPTISRHYGAEAAQYDIDTKKELRSNKWHKDFSMAPVDFLGEYCKKDVAFTARLYQDLAKKLIESKQVKIWALQVDLTSVLFNMEKRGISVDKLYAMESQKTVLNRLEEVEKEIHALAEQEFNISSTKQVGEVFNAMGIESPVKTPKGKDSWNELALVNIDHKIAGLLRQYRTLEKLRSTYIEPYTETDIMRTAFCNWGTSTGRLSSRNPNLQNIPRNHFILTDKILTDEEKENLDKRIKSAFASKGQNISTTLSPDVLETWAFVGDESYDDLDDKQVAIRRLFISRPNYTLVAFDYSQMEVRVFLSYFRNEITNVLLNQQDVDFHTEAAKLAFNVTEEDEGFKDFRQKAKAITFGTIYGIGNQKLSQQLNTSPREAGKYKRQYFSAMKGSKEFFDEAVKKVELRGWVKNRYGRMYRIPKDIAYKAVNYLVQGTSADILSERMIEIDKYLADKKSNILLQVHDEIICEIHDSELETIPNVIKNLLEENSLDIPLTVDVELCSPSWATKKDFKVPTEADYIDWDDVPVIDKPVIDRNGIEWT